MDWLLLPLRRYATFSGRARRLEYWPYILVWTALFAGCVAVDIAFNLGGAADGTWFESYDGGVSFNIAFGPCALLLALVTALPNLAVGVRRLHDIGMSGWLLLVGIIPLLGWIVLLVFLLRPGTAGPNTYGPDPKEAPASPVFS